MFIYLKDSQFRICQVSLNASSAKLKKIQADFIHAQL